ncbi:MAG: hypothetical protein ACLTXI_01790 [Collinsella sp.]
MLTYAHDTGLSILNRKITGQSLSMGLSYVLLLGVCAGWLLSLGKVSFLLTLVVVAIAAVGSSETCCRLLFACFPFFNVMGADLGGTSMFYLLVLLYVLKATIDGSVAHTRERYVALMLIFVFTVYNIDAGLTYVKWLIHLAAPLFVLGTARLKENFPTYVRFLTVSLVISGFMGLMMMDRGVYLIPSEPSTPAWTSTRFPLVYDSVVFGQVVALVGGERYLMYGEDVHGAFPIMLVWSSRFDYSKGALICLAIVGVFALFGFVRKAARDGLPVRYLVGAVLALAAAYLLATYMLSGSSLFSADALATRLDSSDLLTARRDIWNAYFKLWDSTGLPMLFKGIGFDTYLSTTVYGRWHNCHNLYIEAVTLFGWIVTVVMAVALASHFVNMKRKGAAFFAYMPCILLLASGFILHGFLDFPFFYEWTVALGCLEFAATGAGERKNEKQKEAYSAIKSFIEP